MARIRSVKPEFWTDPDVVACPAFARLLFIGCWNHADDYGVLKDDPARLRLQILPTDDVDPFALVDELVARRLLLRKVALDGSNVLVIRTFCEHQKIDRRSPGKYGNPAEFPGDPTGPAQSPPSPTTPDPGGVLVLEGKENTPSSPPAKVSAAEFDAFWSLYPRRVCKADATKAYAKARKTAEAAAITAGLTAWIATWDRENRPHDKMPHAATWLNGQRWEDPPATETERRPVASLRRPDPTEATAAAAVARYEREDARRRGEACERCEGTAQVEREPNTYVPCPDCNPAWNAS